MRSHSKKNLTNSAISKSRKSVDAPKSATVQQIGASNSTSINQLKPAKTTRNRIPPPQRERIVQEYVAGKSIAQISREEDRNRETISRIVNGDKVQELVQDMRAKTYGLISDAVAALGHALQVTKDPRVAYRLLVDFRVIPTPAEAEANAAIQPPPEELTPFQRTMAQDESGRISPTGLLLARAWEEKAEMFNFRLSTEDEVRQRKAIAALMDKMTRGQAFSLLNGQELSRLKALAEEVLQRTMSDEKIVAVLKQYSNNADG